MNWYLVQTKSNNEKVALYNLQKQGYLAWCPEYKKKKLGTQEKLK